MKKMKKYRIKIIIAILLILLAVIGIPAVVTADVGPKPELAVKVVNPPRGEYYLDLLVKDQHKYSFLQDREHYDQGKLSLLENYSEGGWEPGLTLGTRVPMRGALTGEKTNYGMLHTFGYVGVPEYFKIIIITPENKVIVSEEIHRTSFKAVLTYDYAVNQVTMEAVSISYIKQFIWTCLTTLFIEGLLLLLFGFSLRKNWLVFLITNVITQLFMTFTLGGFFVRQGYLSAIIMFLPIELVIAAAETIAFRLLLKDQNKARRVGYSITANLLSAAVGLVIMIFEYT